jgi:hypothetical protein
MLALGFDVQLFEKNDRLMQEASGNNQFRLHLGFHYPRHSGTRIQSRDGFSRFVERYSDLSRSVSENIYAVPKDTSLIDFDTYKLIMTATGIKYRTVEKCGLELQNVDGLLAADERVLLLEKSRSYFTNHLRGVANLSSPVASIEEAERYVSVNGRRFDYLIDATWGHFSKVQTPTYYEPTLLLYFEGRPGMPAVTFVDGPLYSIYPTEIDTIYTLSSVPHTPLGRYETSKAARSALDAVDGLIVAGKRKLMIEQARQNVPQFTELFEFIGPQLSTKTKPVGNSDDRSCYVGRNGRVFSVMSGKIDTIFFAMERILEMIESDADEIRRDVPSTLAESIRRKAAEVNGRAILS